jgi:hypothetical protein
MKVNQTRNSILSVTTIIVALSFPAITRATLITFDDLSVSPGVGSPINNYDGLHWSNFYVKNTLGAPTTGYINGTVSPNNVAYNGSGTVAYFYDTPFTYFNFDSCYFTAAVNDGLNVEVQGFIGNTVAYDNTYVVNTEAPTLINFNYLGVSEVKFISSGGVFQGYPGFAGGTQFVMDNLTISAVPEPTSLAFGGLGGLASLIAFRCWK